MPPDASRNFVQHLVAIAAPTQSTRLRKSERIANALDALIESSVAVWPDFRVDAMDFVEHVGRHVRDAPHLTEAVEVLRGPDLYLALACGLGRRKALAVFESQYLATVPRFLGRFHLRPTKRDDLLQSVREKLLVGEREPKILEYAGRGPLESWLRVVVTRAAISLARRRDEDDDRTALDDLDLGVAENAELDLIKHRYAGEYAGAVRAAVASLSPKDRTLLRLHFVDGLSIDRLATMYQVHRATAARWLARCREDLVRDTRRALMEKLKLTESEFASVMRAVHSELDVNVSSLLREAKPPL